MLTAQIFFFISMLNAQITGTLYTSLMSNPLIEYMRKNWEENKPMITNSQGRHDFMQHCVASVRQIVL